MLEWKTIKGYNNEMSYKSQKDIGEVDLPELNEEILISFLNETRPDRPPFVGYFKEDNKGCVWIIVSADVGSLYEMRDGIKWARFNRPSN